jgi:hypothetical protein
MIQAEIPAQRGWSTEALPILNHEIVPMKRAQKHLQCTPFQGLLLNDKSSALPPVPDLCPGKLKALLAQ